MEKVLNEQGLAILYEFPCISCGRTYSSIDLDDELVCQQCAQAQCAANLSDQMRISDGMPVDVETDSDFSSCYDGGESDGSHTDSDSEPELDISYGEVQALGLEEAVCALFTQLYAQAHEIIRAAPDDEELGRALALLYLVIGLEWQFHKSG
ncbi:hypothetical protein DFH06DRAFT_1245621 [Mycena polygramma]|nr:hypothetical protein DFH06DRAFT_1245621 [Mycena polygramma]